MPTLLTFGDSNTYGAAPIEVLGQSHRYDTETRWPCIAAQKLGKEWTLLEEGLPGRTTRHKDPEMGTHMDGSIGLRIALESHGPIDFMTLFLGVNDLKSHFRMTAEGIAEDVGMLVDVALSDDMQDRHNKFQILLICPPPIFEQGPISEQFDGGHEKSLLLSKAYRKIAKDRGVEYFDAATVIASSPIDGIHYGAEMHSKLGDAIAGVLAGMSK